MEKILIVEDDSFFCNLFTELLREHGYDVESASSGEEGLRMLGERSFELLVTDLVMPGVDGMEILTRAKEIDPSLDVIMVTGNADIESAVYSLKHGARDYIVKPVNNEKFLHSIEQCFEQRRILDENEELKSMLNLYQTSQTIAGCLEVDRVYYLMLDSILREIGVSRGIGLFAADNSFELFNVKGITNQVAEHIKDVVLACATRNVPANRPMLRVQFSEKSAAFSGVTESGIEEAYLIFVRCKGELQGIIVAFNEPGLRLPDFSLKSRNIAFLMEQSVLALDNAKSYMQAKDMLFIDDLSGLYNQRYLEVALEREIKRVERYSSQLAVLFLDMDTFKQVNDTHGHLVGSSLLKEMGTLLKQSVRDVDVVIRYGGDEYTAILLETSPELAGMVAERIRTTVESHVFMADEGYNIHLTCSIGYACCPEDTLSKEELLEMADQAMYAGKGSGKNCVVRFSKDQFQFS